MESFNNESNSYLSIMKETCKNKLFELKTIEFLLEYVFEIGKRLLNFVSYQECINKDNHHYAWSQINYLEHSMGILYSTLGDIEDNDEEEAVITGDCEKKTDKEIILNENTFMFDLKDVDYSKIKIYENENDRFEFNNSIVHIYDSLNEMYSMLNNSQEVMKSNHIDIHEMTDEITRHILHIQIHIGLMYDLDL